MSTKPHAFVAMPFGSKPGADNTLIDFNRIYRELIAPALEDAGLEVFRADQEIRAGDILTDMFQELLVADLVVADLTIDNPNVWYELGVRHALRARGVVIVCGGARTTAFDLYTDRKLRYGLKDGAPDPATLEEDKRKPSPRWSRRRWSPGTGARSARSTTCCRTCRSRTGRRLRIGDVREFWEQHDAWETPHRSGAARPDGSAICWCWPTKAPIAAFRADAWIRAGEALRRAERFEFALEHLERGLEIEPMNLGASA